MKRVVALLMFLALFMGAESCGPIQANTNISKAKYNLAQARLAKAHELIQGTYYITPAQHKYQLALLYLEKAKEMEGFSKYEHAAFFAQRAAELADEAIVLMKEEQEHKKKREIIRKNEWYKQGPSGPTTPESNLPAPGNPAQPKVK